MNTTTSKETKAGKGGEAAAPPAGAATGGSATGAAGAPANFESATPDKDWVTFNTNRMIYKPDLCHEKAVRGYLLDYLEMPAVDGDREWNTYIVKLTQPTIACDREGNVHPVAAGEEIMVPEVYDLEHCPALRTACENPEETYEVFLKPVERTKIGGGKTLWRYDIKFAPKPTKRTGSLKLFMAAGKRPELANNAAAAPAPFSS